MKNKNDNVFQLSLTEIAFILILLMVLLLGAKLVNSINKQNKLSDELTITKKELELLKKRYERSEYLCKLEPDDPISTMMPCVKCIHRQANISKTEAEQALSLGIKVIKAINSLDNQIPFDELENKIEEVSKVIAKGDTLIHKEDLIENEKLEQQNLSLKKSLEKCSVNTEFYKRRSGLDYPSCWIDKNGKNIQYLANVTIRNDQLVQVDPAWPTEREEEARNMAPLMNMIKNSPMEFDEFQRNAYQILLAHNKGEDACRFFVRLRNQIPDRATADKARLKVEQFFYKYELH